MSRVMDRFCISLVDVICEWMHLTKLIKLHTKNLCGFLYVNYTSVEVCITKRRKFSSLPPPLLPFPEETTGNSLCVFV